MVLMTSSPQRLRKITFDNFWYLAEQAVFHGLPERSENSPRAATAAEESAAAVSGPLSVLFVIVGGEALRR